VITKINKEYAGQGQKVMNAMWGAGQMMFNKILVLADQGIRIQDYPALARYVFKNLNPVTDVVFSSGPMDVLDHSCSKMGFGGKMCIDGTTKFPEEIEDGISAVMPTLPAQDIAAAITLAFSEVKAVNASLTEQQIPCLLVAVKKDRPGHIRSLHSAISQLPAVKGIKMILYVEHTVDPQDLATALWRFCNNLDPKRDQQLYRSEDNPASGCLGLDGTRKTKELDNFQRDWPNIIVANDATIRSVDEKWGQLGLGEFISSPSLKYKDQLYGEEAIVEN
jgi:4-hydroxy-3-polyprenylbenzoate decarboxylase